MSDYMLGVDIGTTSTKAVLFDTDGHVVAHRTVGYPLLTPTPATAEQDPEEIYRAVLAAIKTSVQEALKRGEDTKRNLKHVSAPGDRQGVKSESL